jgi:hypothetical protein
MTGLAGPTTGRFHNTSVTLHVEVKTRFVFLHRVLRALLKHHVAVNAAIEEGGSSPAPTITPEQVKFMQQMVDCLKVRSCLPIFVASFSSSRVKRCGSSRRGDFFRLFSKAVSV